MRMRQKMAFDNRWSGFLAEIQRIEKEENKSLLSKKSGSAKPSSEMDTPRKDISNLPPSNPDPDDKTDDEVSKAEKSYINKLLNTKLVETQACDIEMLREDPSNPLHSVKTFQDLKLLAYFFSLINFP